MAPDREKLIKVVVEVLEGNPVWQKRRELAVQIVDALAALPAEPEPGPVIHHVCGDDCSAPVRATGPVRAAAEALVEDVQQRAMSERPVSVRAALKTARECLEYLLNHHTDGQECLCPAARSVAAAGLSLSEAAAALSDPPEGESE